MSQPRSHASPTGTLALLASMLAAGGVLHGSLRAQAPDWQLARVLEGRRTAMAFDATRGTTVLFGGMNEFGQLLGDTWERTSGSWQRRSRSGGPSPRFGHAMGYDAARRRIVLFGGGDATGVYGDTWTWNGDAWTQSAVATSPPARYGHWMCYDSVRARIVVHGGLNAPTQYTDTWEWDGATWQLRTSGGPLTQLSNAFAFDVPRARAVAVVHTANGQPLRTWEYNGIAWQLRAPALAPPSRQGGVLVFDSVRNRTVLFGGAANGYLGDTWEWDGTTWSTFSGGPSARADASAAFDTARGCAVLYGGTDYQSVLFDNHPTDTWERNGVTWSLAAPSTRPDPRSGMAIAVDEANQQVVIHGGAATMSQSTQTFNDTWTWSGAAWLRHPGPTQAIPYGTMAWDAVGNAVLLFGGNFTPGSGWTWAWNGTAWSQRSPATSPPARTRHAMVCDHARQRIVLFGGSSVPIPFLGPPPTLFADTWEWDGTNWLQRFPTNSPPARRSHGMADDQARQCVVLHGGESLTAPFGDTWEWDGTNWTLRQTAAPSGPRRGHAMAYDTARQRVAIAGGDINPVLLWEWDGATWSAVPTTTAPGTLLYPAMAPDPGRDRLLLFGGTLYRPRPETWWFGSLLPAAAQTIGVPCPNVDAPVLTSNESHFGNAEFRLSLLGAPAGAPCLFGWSTSSTPVSIGACQLYLDQPIVLQIAIADGAGVGNASVWPQAPVATWRGWQVYAQAVTLDAAGPLGLAFSAARRFTIGD